jgi:GTP-binding protein
LKHVERCGVLLHLIDASSEDVVENYRVIRAELAGYSPELLKKSEIIALNKTDILSPEEIKEKFAQLKKFLKKNGETKPVIFAISAISGVGTKEVLRQLYKKINEYRQINV